MVKKTYLAYLIRTADNYFILDNDGTVKPVSTTVTDEGYLSLPPNAANRKYFSLAKAQKHFSKTTEPIGLTYKTTRHLANIPTKTPNDHLIPYMPADDLATYMAIVERTYCIMRQTGQKSFIDSISDEDYPLYNSILDKAAYAKSLAPRAKIARKPLSSSQRRKIAEAKLSKAQAALAALEESMEL